MKRSEIKEDYKWDLSELYTNFKDWEDDLAKTKPLIEDIKKYKGHLLDSAENLYNYLKADDKIAYYLERLNFYAFLVVNEDITNTEAQKYLDIIEDAITDYNNVIAFVNPEILKSDMSVIEKYMEELSELRDYERFFKEVFRLKNHLLNESEEALINSMTNIAQNFKNSSQIISDSEIDFGSITDENGKEVKLMASNIVKYIRSSDREVRKQVYEQESLGFEKHLNSLATNYIGYIKTFETEAKFRKYNSFLEQKLDSRELNMSIYETIKKVTKKNIPIYRKFLQFVRDCLDLEKLEAYDLNAPLIKNSNKEYSIEEAQGILLKAFEIYGEEYTDVLKYAFDNRCIDFMPCENKVTGWFSAYIPFAKPKIMGNYNGRILDISSLAHELGHFVNQYKIVETQPPQYVYQSIFCAEVSSLTNEIVFSSRMQEIEPDIEVKKELLVNFIKTFSNNFFGAIRQALFEEEAHMAIVDGKGVSSKEFSNMWKNIQNEFNAGEIESRHSIGWAAIPHFYKSGGYYVFNYATGIVAACNLANKLLNNEEGILEKFMNYLTIGNSLSPIESLKTLGIDMTTDEPYEVAIKMFAEAIDEFYKLEDK